MIESDGTADSSSEEGKVHPYDSLLGEEGYITQEDDDGYDDEDEVEEDWRTPCGCVRKGCSRYCHGDCELCGENKECGGSESDIME